MAKQKKLRTPDGFQSLTEEQKIRWYRAQLGFGFRNTPPEVIEIAKGRNADMPDKVALAARMQALNIRSMYDTYSRTHTFTFKSITKDEIGWVNRHIPGAFRGKIVLEGDEVALKMARETFDAFPSHVRQTLVGIDPSSFYGTKTIKTKLDAAYGKLAAIKNEETRLELAPVEKPKSLATYPHEMLYNIAPGEICRLRGNEYKVKQTEWDDYELYIKVRWWIFWWWKKIFVLGWRQLNGAETAAQRADALFRAYWDQQDEWWTKPT